jgi:hypothetical protein
MGALGGLVDKIFGHGDYEFAPEDIPEVNSFVPGRHRLDAIAAGNSIPEGLAAGNMQSEISRAGVHSVRLTRREYVGEVRSSMNFNVSKYRLDIATGDLGPWAGSFAEHFTKYTWEGVVLTVDSLANPVTGVLNSGQIGLGTQYDPEGEPPATMRELLSREHSVQGRPTDNLVHMVECAASTQGINPLWVDPNPDAEADPRTTSLGNFYIATDAMPMDDVVIGSLWCSYDVVFYAPRLPLSLANKQEGMALWQFSNTSAPTNISPFGTPSIPLPDPVFRTAKAITIEHAANGDPARPWLTLPLGDSPARDFHYVVVYSVGCTPVQGTSSGMNTPSIILIPETVPPPNEGVVYMESGFFLGMTNGQAWGVQAPDATQNWYPTWTGTQTILGLVRCPYKQGASVGRLSVTGGGGIAGNPPYQASLLVVQLPPSVVTEMRASFDALNAAETAKATEMAISQLMTRLKNLEDNTCVYVPKQVTAAAT